MRMKMYVCIYIYVRHDGAGVTTHHMGFTLMAEQSLQALSPSVSMPYWEYAMVTRTLYTYTSTSIYIYTHSYTDIPTQRVAVLCVNQCMCLYTHILVFTHKYNLCGYILYVVIYVCIYILCVCL